MPETTFDEVTERRQRDNSRMRKVATRHAAIVLTALTVWGTSDYWAAETGLLLAETVSLINAIFAGTITAFIFHEWGHFSGARVSGAVSPVLKEPVSFFMFNFKDELNTQGQFLSMSAGGPTANWGLFILMLILLPLDTWSQGMFLATTFAIAVSVSVFEFPIINRVMYGDNPAETIEKRQRESGKTPRTTGIIAG
ncbi:MAG: hypothetical protein ACNYPE_16980, partial [Candidatus Azotimanducaceae bacterium WSBS_2022_MAG_OTU7]